MANNGEDPEEYRSLVKYLKLFLYSHKNHSVANLNENKERKKGKERQGKKKGKRGKNNSKIVSPAARQ